MTNSGYWPARELLPLSLFSQSAIRSKAVSTMASKLVMAGLAAKQTLRAGETTHKNRRRKWRRGRSGPTRTARFLADRLEYRGNHHRRGEHALVQHVGCLREHRHRSPVRGESALERRSFSSLIDLTPGVALTPANQFEGGQNFEGGLWELGD
jgi:hypothetical protein